MEDTQERVDGVFGFTAAQAKALHDQRRASDAVAATKFGEIVFYSLQGLDAVAGEQVLQCFGEFALSSLSYASEVPFVQALSAMVPLSRMPGGERTYNRGRVGI